MKNPYETTYETEERATAGAEAAQSLEEILQDIPIGSGSGSTFTTFELPSGERALFVMRFSGPDAVAQAKRLYTLIEGWR